MSYKREQYRSAQHFRRPFWIGPFILFFLITSPACFARNTNARWCFPKTTWFGGTGPVVDGTIDADIGWRGGYRYVYDAAVNGTPLNDVVMQGTTTVGTITQGSVYLSFEVHKPTDFSDNDLIVIGFDPDGTAANQQLFEIRPVLKGETTSGLATNPTTGFSVGAAVQNVAYWKGNSTFSGNPQATPPQWVQSLSAKVLTSDGPTDFAYTLELQIPVDPAGTAGIALPSSGDFGMYLNVIRLDETNGTNAQAAWPISADLIGLDLVPPDSLQWGTGSFTGACNGVSIVNNSITDSISPAGTTGTTLVLGTGTSNTFNVSVQNNTVDAKTGLQVLAPQIVPTFNIANFGLPASQQWAPIPVTQPSPHDIDPSASQPYSTGAWTVVPGATGSQQTIDYNNYLANPHQCIQVRLDARPPSTTGICSGANPPTQCLNASIASNAAVQNMNFDNVSQGMMMRGFIAQVGTRGYELPAGFTDQIFDLAVRTQVYTPNRYQPNEPRFSQSSTSTGAGQNLYWTVHGYRHTGKFLLIKGKKYETVSYIGGYGYGLTYSGTNPDWRYQFFGEKGDKIEPLGDGKTTYRLHVKQGETGYLNTVFEGDAAAGSGGPIESGPGSGSGYGHMWPWWWWLVILLLILILFLLLFRRRKQA